MVVSDDTLAQDMCVSCYDQYLQQNHHWQETGWEWERERERERLVSLIFFTHCLIITTISYLYFFVVGAKLVLYSSFVGNFGNVIFHHPPLIDMTQYLWRQTIWSKTKLVFANIDSFVELMSRSDALKWRLGNFCDDRDTQNITLPLAHAYRGGNYLICTIVYYNLIKL